MHRLKVLITHLDMEGLTPKTANWVGPFDAQFLCHTHLDKAIWGQPRGLWVRGGFPATSTLQPKPCHSEVVSRISLSPFATGGKLAEINAIYLWHLTIDIHLWSQMWKEPISVCVKLLSARKWDGYCNALLVTNLAVVPTVSKKLPRPRKSLFIDLLMPWIPNLLDTLFFNA